ncbi:MAG: thiolase family protein [Candidatus Jordarchaeum sp.]|uniref:thiolase family protein n=1 Tax=Candidatus Jordarchaeum sp. TaxID=2823881 RepID=UPI00404A6D4F
MKKGSVVKMSLRNSIALVSYGEVKFERKSEKSVTELCAESCKMAMDQAGIDKGDIDGLFCVPDYMGPDFVGDRAAKVYDYLGIEPDLSSTMDAGGVATYNQIEFAMMAIASGKVKNVLCVSGGKFRAGYGTGVAAHPEFELPYGADIISFYALPATRHMHVYGTTEEQLASVVVAQRKWASMNPNAVFKDIITVDDVVKSPLVIWPYHLFMCSRPADGAGAILVSSAKKAKEYTDTPIRILGMAEHHTHGVLTSIPNLNELGSRITSSAAFKMAGLTPKDIDIAMLTDPFAFLPIEHLEDCGFVKKGEGGKFFEEGHSEPGGELPINTHGGLLCGVHDGVGPLIHHIIESMRQLRGEAEKRQVDGAEVAFLELHGGMMYHHATLILGR